MRHYSIPKETGLITVHQAAELAGRSTECIYKWEKLGYIQPTWWMGRKYYREAQFYETGQVKEASTNG